MSLNRLYLNRNYISRGLQSAYPPFGTVNIYQPGHLFIPQETGEVYRNIGHFAYSMHVGWSNRLELTDRFLQRPGINANAAAPGTDTYNTAQMDLALLKSRNFEVLGTNATSALVTHSDGGGITCTTAGASADQIIIAPHLDTGISAWSVSKWNTADEISFDAVVKTGANITDAVIWAGFKLTNTSVTATDDNQCFFRFATATNSGKWQCVSSRAGTDVETDSGAAAVAVSTAYWLRVVVDGDRKPHWYINGVEVATGTAAVALTDNIDLIPYVGVQASAVAAKAITIRGLACGKSFND